MRKVPLLPHKDSKTVSKTHILDSNPSTNKRMKRLQQNRLSALKCRKKKKAQLSGLMEEKNTLADENKKLMIKVSVSFPIAFVSISDY